MTLPEARAILFLNETLTSVAASLRDDQVRALHEALDLRQKVALMDVLTVTSPPTDFIVEEKRHGWACLVKRANERVAVAEDPLRQVSPP
jgi:hypothetical protein